MDHEVDRNTSDAHKQPAEAVTNAYVKQTLFTWPEGYKVNVTVLHHW